MKQTLQLHIPDMCCPDEIRTLKQALHHLQGIEDTSFDLLQKNAAISFDDEIINQDTIVNALRSTGMSIEFHPIFIKTPHHESRGYSSAPPPPSSSSL